MSFGQKIAWDDTILPFQLDHADIRGRVARLDGVLDGILAQHDYPPQVEALVAEMALLTALIGQTIKLRWKLSLQVQTKGAVRMIATDYFGPTAEGEPARMRAYASFDRDKLGDGSPFAQLGEGYFAVLIDQGKGTTPYQGITPIAGHALRDCAEAYFAQSEQLPTRFALSFGQSREPGGAEHWRAGGVMLQQLPKASPFAVAGGGSGEGGLLKASDIVEGDDAENWNRANLLLDTVEDLELIGPSVAPTDLLVRLFHEEAAARLHHAAGALWLHLFGGARAQQPVDLFGQGYRDDDHRRGDRDRRLPVLRRALPAGSRDARLRRADGGCAGKGDSA